MAEEPTPEVQPEIKPCRHMAQWVNALADGSLTGVARWYTQLHVAGCKHCQSALVALQRLRSHLQALREPETSPPPTTLSPQRRDAVEAAFDALEEQHR